MKLFLKLSLNIIFFSAYFAKAQNVTQYHDYVIPLRKDDTIMCAIKTPFLSTDPVYTTSSSDKSIRILSYQIREYYIMEEDMHYLAVHKNGRRETEFMKAIEKGPINLLEEQAIRTSGMPGTGGVFSNTTTNWYIGKGIDTVRILKTSDLFSIKSKKARKNILTDLIKDKQEVYDKYLADDSFTFEELRSLIHFYNTGEWKTEFKDK